MGELKLPQIEKSAVLTLHTDKDDKTSALQLKLESFKIKINEEYEKPKIAWEYRSSESEEYKPIGTIDNFSLVIGKAKAKKSFFIGMAVSAALSKEVLYGKFKSNLSEEKNEVLYFDTEQSSYHVHLALKRICKQVNIAEPKNLHVYGLRKLSSEERLELIQFAIYDNPKAGFVVIDGIKDLINSINDEVEASKMANNLLRWTEDNHIHIVTVLHQNKGDNNARGHIGTELINKAETVLTVTVDSTNENISIVEPQQCRNKPFDIFAFKINESGDTELVDDFIKSGSKKDNFDIFKTDNETKIKLLQKAFEGSKYLKSTDLKIKIKSAYRSIYKINFGDNKIKAFITHCLELDLLFQEKPREPYFLNSSF
jgi:predicted ATP-dependent serine protease